MQLQAYFQESLDFTIFLQIIYIESIQLSSSTTIKYGVLLSEGLHSHHAFLPIEYNIYIIKEELK